MKDVFRRIFKIKYYVYCLIISFVLLLIASKCSPIYPFNDWVDANAFFTVGKGIFNNVVPYKDVFEQKGFILYFIYGIGSLISYKDFFGIFVLEVFSFSIFLYFAHKTFSIFFNKKYSYILIPIVGTFVTISEAFVHGGSCEEFVLPFLSIALYYYFKHFKVKELTIKEIIFNGILAGIVLMMKYTILGFFMGFGFFIFLNYILSRNFKKAIFLCIFYLIGMAIPVGLCVSYFLVNGGLKEFIECYFTFNMTLYNNNSSMLSNIIKVPYTILKSFYVNKDFAFIGILGLSFIIAILNSFKEKKNRYFNISIFGMMLTTTIVIYMGLRTYVYYILPFYVFLIVALVYIVYALNKYFSVIARYFVSYLVIPSICIFVCYLGANYKEMMFKDKEDYFQYKYAKVINQYKDPTLLNYGFLDAGVYTTTGIVPNTRFFEQQNIDYEVFPDNKDEMIKYIKNKEVKFVLYYGAADPNEDKMFIDSLGNNYEHWANLYAYLYKLKGIERK